MKYFEENFDVYDNFEGIVFVIGLQELGLGYKKLKKDEKINVMHIAVCSLLEPYGYYSLEGYDQDGWPHYKRNEELPPLKPMEQERLMKMAIIDYMNSIWQDQD
ncbi:MAG: hypothetical protein MRY83_08495 [Flavobacteriales bacterium]|nr:hypothetical protein [Flavobacteriales bacterium]